MHCRRLLQGARAHAQHTIDAYRFEAGECALYDAVREGLGPARAAGGERAPRHPPTRSPFLLSRIPYHAAKPSLFPAHNTQVALIDFGGATWSHEHHSSVVCTRQYRPPEVTLGLEWSHPVDLWSMGCILTELWTGSLLFSTHDEVEHLALMERTLGALPRTMLRAATCKRADRNFRHGARQHQHRSSSAHILHSLPADPSPQTHTRQPHHTPPFPVGRLFAMAGASDRSRIRGARPLSAAVEGMPGRRPSRRAVTLDSRALRLPRSDSTAARVHARASIDRGGGDAASVCAARDAEWPLWRRRQQWRHRSGLFSCIGGSARASRISERQRDDREAGAADTADGEPADGRAAAACGRSVW